MRCPASYGGIGQAEGGPDRHELIQGLIEAGAQALSLGGGAIGSLQECGQHDQHDFTAFFTSWGRPTGVGVGGSCHRVLNTRIVVFPASRGVYW
jgi:hypothetical protein